MNRNVIEQRRRASWNIQTAFHLGHIRPVVERDPYEGIPKLNAFSERWLLVTNPRELDKIMGQRIQRENQIAQRQKAEARLREDWTPGSWA